MQSPFQLVKADQIVDVRPWGTRAAEKLATPEPLLLTVAGLCLLMWLVPMLVPAVVVALLVVFVASKSVGHVLPLRYPQGAKDKKGKKGDGILFLGNMGYSRDRAKRLPLESPLNLFKEVWLSDDDARKHFLIIGSTGSGKSELLKGIFYNALCWGSGFFVADGKADNKLPLDIYAMARMFGRDDDLLWQNFLLAGKTPEQVKSMRRRRTNGTNPVSTADADTIVQMGANLLPKVDGDAKNWQEKALNLWRGEVPALVYLRDHEGAEISIKTFVDYLALPKLEELYAKGYKMAQANGGVWHPDFEGLRAYLEVGLPGFKVERCLKKHKLMPSGPSGGPMSKPEPTEQDSNTYDQHGYRTTQLNPALNLLYKTYGHIFGDKFSEIDMVDVTLNDRILGMLIPSLERSAQEAESLGKLTVAVLRVMMGKNLGADIEGRREQILESKATESDYPYIVALDELGYYFADGIAVMFAQARSLGFSMIAAAQDVEKLTEGSRAAEAGAMLANQVVKLFMRIDDANKTNELIQKYLEKVTVALRKNYVWNDTFGHKRMQEVSIEEIPSVTLQGLQGLGAGEVVVSAMGTSFKMKSFYIGERLAKNKRENFHINRFLQVRGLTSDEVAEESLPIDVANDPHVKGQKLKDLLSGEGDVPDMRELAARGPYAQDHEKAMQMIAAVQRALAQAPSSLKGSQRAVVMFEAARRFLRPEVSEPVAGAVTGRSSGAASPVSRNTHEGEEATVTPQQALEAVDVLLSRGAAPVAKPSGALIEDGSGTGHAAAPLEMVDDDPLAFLNEGRPLVRKPAQDVIGAVPVSAPVQSLARPELAAVDVTGASAALESALLTAFGAAFVFDLAPAHAAQGERPQELMPSADSAWIGRALEGAETGLASKGDTLVGMTKETITSFVELEKALGNPRPAEAAAAIEQIVAQQTTPDALPETGADFDDIASLVDLIDSTASGGR